MRSAVFSVSLLLAGTLPAAAQVRPIVRPFPIPLPAVSSAQPVKIYFRVRPDTNSTSFQGMDITFSDGSSVSDWKIPSGKMLVLTDFSIAHYLYGRPTYDIVGQVEESFPSGASFTVFPISIKAGQQHVSSVHALTTGLSYSQPDGPAFSLSIDTLGGVSFQSNQLWAFGYLTDAN